MRKKCRKLLTCFLVVTMLMTMSASLVFAADQVRIVNQGSFLAFEVPPQIINGRTMVPMREIFENVFGCTVKWDGADKSITAVSPDTAPITIQMKIDDQTMYVNGEPILIDVPPQIVSGRTLVPLKAISSSLGMGVGYDSARKIVVLGLATDDPQEVLAVNAEDYVDLPAEQPAAQQPAAQKTDMYGDVDLLKLYTVASPVAGYMYEVKGHPYEGQYQVLLNATKNGSIVSKDMSIQKLNMPDMSKKVTWKDVDGKTHTHTVGALYELFPLLKLKNGNDWCFKTFGDIFEEYSMIPASELERAINHYVDKYL